MDLVKIDVEKKEEEYSFQRKWKALLFVLLFHIVVLFALYKFGFDRTYPPPPMHGIEIAIELERPRPQGIPRRNIQQKPVDNPPVVNVPGKSAPESAKASTSDESTKSAPQPEAKASELNNEGDIPVKAPEPKIDNRALFQSDTKGEKDANNPNPIDENNLYSGVGHDNESTRTANTPPGPDHRQPITHNLSGRSVMGGFPKPAYDSPNQGKVVVEVVVNQEGKVTSARALVKGSTIQDAILFKAAEEAAMKTRFNIKKDAPISQIGTIIYVFSLT
jgi:TonB family protein